MGRVLGRNRLLEALEKNPDKPSAVVLEDLFEDFLDFEGHADLAIMVILTGWDPNNENPSFGISSFGMEDVTQNYLSQNQITNDGLEPGDYVVSSRVKAFATTVLATTTDLEDIQSDLVFPQLGNFTCDDKICSGRRDWSWAVYVIHLSKDLTAVYRTWNGGDQPLEGIEVPDVSLLKSMGVILVNKDDFYAKIAEKKEAKKKS